MARRINTRFASALGLIGLVVVGGGFVARKFLFPQRPDQFIAAGHEAEGRGDWRTAVDNYSIASRLDPTNADLQLHLGWAIHNEMAVEPAMTGQDVAAWQRAVEIDPNNEQALRALLAAADQRTQLTTARADAFNTEIDLIKRLHAVVPDDKKVAAMLPMTLVRSWLVGTDTDQDSINNALADMRKYMSDDPANADIPYFIALAKIHRAVDALGVEDNDTATQNLNDATGVFDAALQTQDKNAAMHFRYSQALLQMSQSVKDTTQSKTYLQSADSHAQTAMSLSRPGDAMHIQINLSAARIAGMLNDPARSERILRQLFREDPNNLEVRVALANQLEGSLPRTEEAITILQETHTTGSQQDYILSLLANKQITAYQMCSNPADKAAMAKAMNATYDSLYKDLGETTDTMKIKGNIDIVTGDVVDAIEILSRAYTTQQTVDPMGNEIHDYYLMFLLGRALYDGQQRAKATDMLSQVVDKIPDFEAARRLLIQADLDDGDLDDANQYLKYLVQREPDDPQVILFELALLGPNPDPTKLRALYDRMPEQTASELLQKANRALVLLKDPGEALRLLKLASDKAPGDSTVAIQLARLYEAEHHPDLARQTLATALEINPNDFQLQLLNQQMRDPSPAALYALRHKQIASNPDAMSREIQFAQLDGEQRDVKGVESHLKAAEQIDPTNKAPLEALFQFYIQRHDFASAQGYVDKLSAINADKADGLIYLFNLQMAEQKYSDAEVTANQLTQKHPQFAVSWYSLGQTMEATGRYEDAVTDYAAALDRDASSVSAVKGLTECYDALGRQADAISYLEQAMKALPDDNQIKSLAVDHYVQHGDFSKAQAVLQGEVAQNPENADGVLALSNVDLDWAASLMGRNETSEAQKPFDDARQLLSQAIDTWPDVLQFYAGMARASLMDKDFAGGEALLLQAADRPNLKGKVDPQMVLGVYYRQAGHLDLAESALRKAISLDANRLDAVQMLGNVLTQDRKFDEALALLKGYTDPALMRQSVAVLIAAKRFDAAETALQQLLVTNPADSAGLQAQWALLCLERGDHSGANQHVDAALAINAQLPDALMARAQARLASNPPRIDDALKDLLTLRDELPDNPQVRRLLSEAYRAKGDWESCISELSTAVRLAPDDHSMRVEIIQDCLSATPQRLSQGQTFVDSVADNPLFQHDADFQNVAAVLHLDRGDVQPALDAASAAKAIDPSNEQYAKTYFDILLSSKQYQALFDSANAYLTQQKQPIWWLYQMRGIAKKNLGDSPGAIDDLTAALKLTIAAKNPAASSSVVNSIAQAIGIDAALSALPDSNDIEWQQMRVVLYNAKGDTNAAVACMDKLLGGVDALPPDRQLAVLRMADLLYGGIRPVPMAQKAYQIELQILKLAPNDLQTLNNAASHLDDDIKPADPAQALLYAKQAVDLMTNANQMIPSVMDTYGWAQFCAGQENDGAETLERVVDDKPYPTVCYHLGEVYLKLGQLDDAERVVTIGLDEISKATASNAAAGSSSATPAVASTGSADSSTNAGGSSPDADGSTANSTGSSADHSPATTVIDPGVSAQLADLQARIATAQKAKQ